jgi:activator of 2-hydroxyglutaryl-CoA dehydratase
MTGRVGKGHLVVLTGGVARNDGVRSFLSRELDREIIVSPESQFAGALVAALLAQERLVGQFSKT